MIKFPKLSTIIPSKSSIQLNCQNKSANSIPYKNSPVMTSSMANTNNIFYSPLSNSRCINNDTSSKWIINKLDKNTERIITSYKKDATPQFTEEIQEESIKIIKCRRRRMILKCQNSNSFSLPHEYNSSEFQPREKLTTPPNNSIASPLKKRQVKRSNLFIQSSFSTSGQANQNSKDFNDEMASSNNNMSKENLRSTQDSLSAIGMTNSTELAIGKSQQSLFSLQSDRIFRPFFLQNKQTSIVISPNLESEIEHSSPCLISLEDFPYNFTKSKKRSNTLTPIQKGILKNISELNIMTKSSLKKQVTFKNKNEVF